MTWQAYPKYKDSGVEWLGEIPEHWGARRLKYVSSLNDETLGETTDPDFELLYVDISSVDAIAGIQHKENLVFQDAPSRARRRVRHGDVIVSTVRTYLRAIAPIVEPEENLIVSTGFAVVRPTNDLESRFAFYALRAPYFVEAVVANSVGVSYPAINSSELATLFLALPPEDEQRAIAAFLDRETERLDALIARKEQQIELLQEKRAALISHAVTKGLDPNAPMKDSGIEWLGEIPAHWEVKRLKFIASIQSGVAKGRDLKGRTIVELPYLRVANVQSGYVDLSDVATIAIAEDEIERYALLPGDVLMTEGGDYDKLGRGTVWEGQITPCIHQNHIFAVRPHHERDSYWVSTITQADYTRHFFILRSKQSTNLASISSMNIMELPVALPPTHEREAILSHLSDETTELDTLIAKVREAIERLQEYRTALISAAVTGKIDVREDEEQVQRTS